MNDTVLALKDISKIYPGTVALKHVNFEIMHGEVHGIIGKNGAGKSTLVGIISGIIAPSSGEIRLENTRLEHLNRISAKKKHISIVPQEPQVILDISVAENLFLGDYPGKRGLVKWGTIFQRAEEIFSSVGLHINVRAKAGDLSISEQQLLLVLKACYVEDARIIILDEASASLSQNDEKILYEIIAERKKAGRTIILISHRTDELLAICDRVTVLRDGRSVKTASCADLNREQLASLIVGEDFQDDSLVEGAGDISDRTMLSVKELTRAGFFHDIGFSVKKGEILGLAGLRGSGRTEIFKSIVGIDPLDRGHIEIGGVKKRPVSPSHSLEDGVVYLPEDREKEGLVSVLSVRENLVLNSLKQISKGAWISKRKEEELTERLIKTFSIMTATAEQEVSQLSGGNKQKVVVGKIAAFMPKVFLLDEPTRGIDISAKQSILRMIRTKLRKTAGIVITSPGLEDLLSVCDRILVLYKGEIVREYDRKDFKEGEIYLAMQGQSSKES